MQILSNTNNNQQKPNFQGLNRYLSRHFPQEGIGVISKQTVSSSKFVMEAIKKYPKSRRFVGNLPHDWIEKLPIENRKQHVQKVQDLFSNFAETMHSSYGKYSSTFVENTNAVNTFQMELGKLLDLNINFSSLPEGEGDFVKAYKLDAGIKSYVFRIFNSDTTLEKHINVSGKLVEPARAPFAMRTSTKSFAKFYFGKIAGLQNKDGFMLTEYLQKENMNYDKKLKRLFKLLTSRIISLDIDVFKSYSKNLLNLKIYDYGDLVQQPANYLNQLKHVNTKTDVREIAKIINDAPPKINTESSIRNNTNYLNNIFALISEMERKNLHD